jgi:hypothetical protein
MFAHKSSIKIVFILLFFIFCNTLFAQQNLAKIDTSQNLVNQKDINDVFHSVFKRKTEKVISEPKKVYLTLLPAAGYTLQTGFAGIISSQAAFYTDTTANKNLSSIASSITYTQYNQFLFPLTANVWLQKNNYNLIIDYRFLKYPSTTYGIGARTLDNDSYTIDYNYIKLHQSILKKVYEDLYGGIGFYYDYLWNIKEVDPPPGVKTSFEKYGSSEKEVAAAIVFRLLLDTRDNQINPLSGSFVNIIYRPNYTFFGSDNNWKSLQFEYRKYIKLSPNSNNILALWSYNWITLDKHKPGYLLLPSTAWDDQYNTGRGYQQGRFRAKDMFYAEAEFRYGITNNGLIGGVVFGNIQSFSRSISTQLHVFAPGYGAGLRIKLNKNSKTNLCVDYGIGNQGSKGIFLNLGEVF